MMTGLLPEKEFSRKSFVKGGGALVVGFSVLGVSVPAGPGRDRQQPSLRGPGALPDLNGGDSWIAVRRTTP